MPFYAKPEIIADLEDKAQASVIPKLAVFSVMKGFNKCVVLDIKNIVLKNANMGEAVSQALAKIKQGEEDFDKRPDTAGDKVVSGGEEDEEL